MSNRKPRKDADGVTLNIADMFIEMAKVSGAHGVSSHLNGKSPAHYLNMAEQLLTEDDPPECETEPEPLRTKWEGPQYSFAYYQDGMGDSLTAEILDTLKQIRDRLPKPPRPSFTADFTLE